MPLVVTAQPATEPVALADAKLFCNVDDDLTDDDQLIKSLIRAARMYAESYTGRSFITQSLRLTIDAFPGAGGGGQLAGAPAGVIYSHPASAIQLDKGQVQSITTITYLAMDGTTQVMPPTDYIADLSGCPGRITPVFGKIWPITMPQIGSARVDYVAGYGPAATDVPDGIADWIRMRVKSRYDARGEITIATRGKIEPLPWVDTMLDPYKVWLA